MNDRFPDATPEELDASVSKLISYSICALNNHITYVLYVEPSKFCRSDATCIICREEMTTAKKLLCGHLFHVHCLRSWLERQNTCPTCRAPVVPAENGTTSGSGQQRPHSNSHQQGNWIIE